ncbi:hypothetical protein FALCPG4_015650 [Fusarium falciforme]
MPYFSRITQEAQVVNLSNFMILTLRAIITSFSKLKCIGSCHEIISLIEHLPVMLNTFIQKLDIKAGGLTTPASW